MEQLLEIKLVHIIPNCGINHTMQLGKSCSIIQLVSSLQN